MQIIGLYLHTPKKKPQSYNKPNKTKTNQPNETPKTYNHNNKICLLNGTKQKGV